MNIETNHSTSVNYLGTQLADNNVKCRQVGNDDLKKIITNNNISHEDDDVHCGFGILSRFVSVVKTVTTNISTFENHLFDLGALIEKK